MNGKQRSPGPIARQDPWSLAQPQCDAPSFSRRRQLYYCQYPYLVPFKIYSCHHVASAKTQSPITSCALVPGISTQNSFPIWNTAIPYGSQTRPLDQPQSRLGTSDGFMRGEFHPLFNAFRGEDASQPRGGVPIDHVPLDIHACTIAGPRDKITQPVLCSRSIRRADISGDLSTTLYVWQVLLFALQR